MTAAALPPAAGEPPVPAVNYDPVALAESVGSAAEKTLPRATRSAINRS